MFMNPIIVDLATNTNIIHYSDDQDKLIMNKIIIRGYICLEEYSKEMTEFILLNILRIDSFSL